jgi:hypothetical protein
MTTDDIDAQRLAIEIVKLATVEASWRPKRAPQSKSAAVFQRISAMRRERALRFLRSSDFRFWCDVAGCDAERIRVGIFERHGLHAVKQPHRYPDAAGPQQNAGPQHDRPAQMFAGW